MISVKHLITGHEVLPDGRVKPSAMLKFMQDAATLDASALGCDYASMRKDDLIFVISKALVTYTRVPKLDEELVVRTWNGAVQGVSFNRDFVMTVEDEEVARATTRWVLVSYTNRRIARPDSLSNSVLTNCDEDIGISPERRIKLPDGAQPLKKIYHPTLTDLDTNFHVNNSRYADYLVDHCCVNLLEKKIVGFEIHFVSELKYTSSVELHSAYENGRAYVIGNKEDGKQAFSSYIDVVDK